MTVLLGLPTPPLATWAQASAGAVGLLGPTGRWTTAAIADEDSAIASTSIVVKIFFIIYLLCVIMDLGKMH
jgi:hypothetical protein